MSILAVIPARGGSQRVPRKNMRMLGGRPLVEHTIDCAKGIKGISEIVVSTGDPEISRVAKAQGVHVVDRPVELRGPGVWGFPVTRDAVLQMTSLLDKDFLYVVHLQPTSPFRKPELIERALKIAEEYKPQMVTSVASAPKYHHPAFLLDDAAPAAPWMLSWNSQLPAGIQGRTEWWKNNPGYYATGSVAVLELPWLLNCDMPKLTNITWPEGTDVRVVVEDDGIANLDIDTEMDFQFAEFVAQSRKKKETTMDLYPFEGHLDNMTGKRVAVVGNSSAMLESGYGKVIDSHDEIIRMNIAATRGFEEDVGSKITVWVTCLPRREAWRGQQLRDKGVHSIWLSNIGPTRQRDIRLSKYTTFPIYWYDYDELARIHKLMDQRPTTGFIVLHALLNHSSPAEIFLCGFTFLKEMKLKDAELAYAARPELRYGNGSGEHKRMKNEIAMARDLIRNATNTKFKIAAHTNDILNLGQEDHVEIVP